jgi:HAD superfamily hydrolase (TIGR01509 family)
VTIEIPAAVLWDMDGTIVDTEPYWQQCQQDLVESFGGVWTKEDGLRNVGMGLWDSARMLQDAGVDLPADDIVARLTDEVLALTLQAPPWRPGAVELLRSVREAGIPTALVTMSIEKMARAIADALPFAAFDVVVAGDLVTHPKPHPEAYLMAASRLGVEPTLCVAIEDSAPGLAAAVAAGTSAIGVPHVTQLPPSAEYTLWETLEHRTVDDLVRVVQPA